jgi:peptide/nickel transport system substrate-binding protein
MVSWRARSAPRRRASAAIRMPNSGAVTNSGGYNSAENDALIEKTLTSGNLSYMYAWQNFISSQLPQEWQPDPAAQLTEIANNLKGVTPQSSTLSINPENWSFVK